MGSFPTEVAVSKEDAARSAPFDLLGNFRHWPAPVLVAKKVAFRAEVAAERTAARGYHREGSEWTVTAEVQQIIPWHGQPCQAGQRFGTVDWLRSPCEGVFQHLRPKRLSLANAQGIAVLDGFFIVECRVRTSHDHRNAAMPKSIGYVIRTRRVKRPGCQGHYVCRITEVDWFELFVQQSDFPIRGCKRCQVRKRQRDDVPPTALEDRAVKL
jgi:hypothetical protein